MIGSSLSEASSLMRRAAAIFWDFDGVIKDSVEAKTIGFEQLFLPYGQEISKRVRRHHEANGGVSRYEKIPLYLEWAGEIITPEKIDEFCGRFSGLVLQAVIDSPWVLGVREYLQENCNRQYFVLLTATPQEEILQILKALEITSLFREVHGAPTPKAAAIRGVLQRLRYSPNEVLVVGDAETDLKAAEENRVAFLLRRTPLNRGMQQRFSGPSFEYLDIELPRGIS